MGILLAIFQSTSPAWGTTGAKETVLCWWQYFNPRPPRGGRRDGKENRKSQRNISIHVPRVGDDETRKLYDHMWRLFQSTSPAWGTTPQFFHCQDDGKISIHVPRVGDDALANVDFAVVLNISIHVPRVGDDFRFFFQIIMIHLFQSTSPVWGTTLYEIFLFFW